MVMAVLFAVVGAADRAHASIGEAASPPVRVAGSVVIDSHELMSWRQRILLLLEIEMLDERRMRPRLETPPPLPAPIVEAVTVYFDFDKAEITPKARAELNRFLASVERLVEDAPIQIMISGHADRAGPDQYNLELSRRRAEAVVNALTGMGLTIEAMSDLRLEAMGEAVLAQPTEDGVSAAVNRRAEITALTHANTAQRGDPKKRARTCSATAYCPGDPVATSGVAAEVPASRWSMVLWVASSGGRWP